jgi:hypothetical protein
MNSKEFMDLYGESLENGESCMAVGQLILSGEYFDAGRIHGVEFVGTDFTNATFVDFDLRGNDFSHAKLNGARFIRCAVYGTPFPLSSGAKFFDCTYELTQPRKTNSRSRKMMQGKADRVNTLVDKLSQTSRSTLVHVALVLSLLAIILLINKL